GLPAWRSFWRLIACSAILSVGTCHVLSRSTWMSAFALVGNNGTVPNAPDLPATFWQEHRTMRHNWSLGAIPLPIAVACLLFVATLAVWTTVQIALAPARDNHPIN